MFVNKSIHTHTEPLSRFFLNFSPFFKKKKIIIIKIINKII